MTRMIRVFLILAGLASPLCAFAASPGKEMNIPSGCHSARDAQDARAVVVSCELALQSERDAPTSAERRAWLLFFRAYAYVELGQIKEAEADLRAAIAAFPNIANCHHELAYVLDDRGDYDGAEAEANEALRLEPASDEHLKERGYARLERGDYAGAAADYTKILSKGEDPLIRALSAYSYALAGELDRARADLAKLPSKAVAKGDFHSLALKLVQVLDPPDTSADAVAVCKRAFDGDLLAEKNARICTAAIRKATSAADRADALRARSIVWFYTFSMSEPAQSDIEAAVRLVPSNASTLMQRCTVLTVTARVKRQVDRAILDCNHALELCGSDTKCVTATHAARATAFLRIKDDQSALADAEIVVKDWPNQPDGYRLRGEAKLGLGDKDGAKADLIRARKNGGRDDHLKELLEKLGLKMDDIAIEQGKPN